MKPFKFSGLKGDQKWSREKLILIRMPSICVIPYNLEHSHTIMTTSEFLIIWGR